MHPQRTEVLIIGAGPTGLFVAAELARHGITPVIIDKDVTPHKQTRATGIQPAVLEAFHRAGIAGPFLEEAVRVKGLRVLDSTLNEAFVSIPEDMDTIFPFTGSMPQWRTEEILNAHLESLGLKVLRGVAAKDIRFTETGAEVTCERETEGTFVIATDYLIGAGGAHSPVRGALQEHLEGITYPLRYLVADVIAHPLPHGDNLLPVIISQKGLVMPVELPGGRTLLITDLPEDDLTSAPLSLDDVRRVLAFHLDVPLEISDLRWASVYRIHRRMAPKFAVGRCFLAGDAAHICSPFGGEGMNAGLLDAASLAWQLAAVLRRGGKQILLDAYETERQQAAAQILESSEAMQEFYYAMVEMVHEGEQPVAPEPDSERRPKSPHMLDLNLPESPLHGPSEPKAMFQPGDRFPDRTKLSGCLHHALVFGGIDETTLAPLKTRWAKVVEILDGTTICSPERAGLPDGGLLLVRPDGHVGLVVKGPSTKTLPVLDAHLATQFEPAG